MKSNEIKKEFEKILKNTIMEIKTKGKTLSVEEVFHLRKMIIQYSEIIKIIEKNKDDILGYVDPKYDFMEIFNKKTGFYARTGVIENGLDFGRDAFMRSYPQLIDVGVMG